MSFSYSSSSFGGAQGFESASFGAAASFESSSFGGAAASASKSGANNIATDLLALIGGNSSASVSASANSAVEWLSQIEQTILRSANPVEISETEELTVLGQRGLWINRAEVNAWRGDIAISEYRIHEDRNPQIITKRVEQVLEYVQELAIRYLRPPTPPGKYNNLFCYI